MPKGIKNMLNPDKFIMPTLRAFYGVAVIPATIIPVLRAFCGTFLLNRKVAKGNKQRAQRIKPTGKILFAPFAVCFFAPFAVKVAVPFFAPFAVNLLTPLR